MHRVRDPSGQASLELLAVLPLLAAIAVLAWQAVVAGQAVGLAGAAARAAARAQAVGEDPQAAVRQVLPPALRGHARVTRAGGGGVAVALGVPLVLRGAIRLGTVRARARFAPQGR